MASAQSNGEVGSDARRVLFVCAEPVDERPLGVAIRTLELARVLSRHAEVTVAGVAPSRETPGGPPVVSYKRFGSPRRSGLARLIAEADAIVAQPPWPQLAQRMRNSPARLIYDLYDPEPLEVIERLRESRRSTRRLATTLTIDRVMQGMADADHLICASEKQRDLWLGAMLAERLITPAAYDRDDSLRSRLDTVPFGLPAEPALARGPGARGRFPRIAPEDELILWNGGIWAWLDAPSAIRAMALLRERRPRARLVFMGASTLPAAARAERQARELAGSLGLLDEHVFFNDAWVPYERRADWLMEADCVLSAQSDHLETRFAFRTRLLDAIWAGLPIVCTAGDDLAQQVERERLGATVPAGSPEAIAGALELVLDQGRAAFSARLAALAPRYAWPVVAAPLVRWATEPYPPARERRPPGRPGQRLRNVAFRSALRGLQALRIERLPSI
ncbi:MAG: glycosyltransferase [Solirubrobacteraceae bacterium]